MKRIIAGILFAASLTLPVEAQQYDFLTFRTTAGSEQSFAASGLKITFSDGKALVSSQGNTVSLPLTELSSMQFTATATSIASPLTQPAVSVSIENGAVIVKGAPGAAVSVASLDGRTLGTKNLPRGLYLVRVGSKTFKVWSK